MSVSPVSSITRASLRKPQDKLNILCAPTHSRYESNLAKTGHSFYALYHDAFIKKWHTEYAPQPENYICLDGDLGENQIPEWLDFDLVLSQNKFGQFQILTQIARQLHLPVLSLEHTLPVPVWSEAQLEECRNMRGSKNVFISEYSVNKWGWDCKDDTQVIRHCVDSTIFHPGNSERENTILTVANDYAGRDWCLNFTQYKTVTEGLPTYPVGDTKGLSNPASSLEELVGIYQSKRIFLNTAHISPIPTSLLEAMACGCACVSCEASEIPFYIKHGVNGMLARNDKEMREYLELLLNDEKLAQELGKEARASVIEKCSVDRFVSEWDVALRQAAEISFRG